MSAPRFDRAPEDREQPHAPASPEARAEISCALHCDLPFFAEGALEAPVRSWGGLDEAGL